MVDKKAESQFYRAAFDWYKSLAQQVRALFVHSYCDFKKVINGEHVALNLLLRLYQLQWINYKFCRTIHLLFQVEKLTEGRPKLLGEPLGFIYFASMLLC